MDPSPRAHVYRMVLLLVVALGAAVFLGGLLVPDTWDRAKWFRQAALAELLEKPAAHGGNESCGAVACHETPKGHAERLASLPKGFHAALACESCHGPLSNHADSGRKTADARVARTADACLICHAPLEGRDGKVAQFSPEHPVHKAMQVTEAKYCGQCHNPHVPKPR